MPPAFLVALGAVGAALVAKLLVDAGRKAREEEEKKRAEGAPAPKLERDPKTGEYRPPRA
jgi:hypothetical protein